MIEKKISLADLEKDPSLKEIFKNLKVRFGKTKAGFPAFF